MQVSVVCSGLADQDGRAMSLLGCLEFVYFCLGLFDVRLNARGLVGVVGLFFGRDQELLHLGDFLT